VISALPKRNQDPMGLSYAYLDASHDATKQTTWSAHTVVWSVDCRHCCTFSVAAVYSCYCYRFSHHRPVYRTPVDAVSTTMELVVTFSSIHASCLSVCAYCIALSLTMARHDI